MTLSDVLTFLGVVMLVTLVDMWLDRKFPCDCGRTRDWYFYAGRHPRGGVFLGRALWITTWTILFVFTLDPIASVIGALIGVHAWRAWWFHEKDKLKKKAAKLAGRVSFNQHGKLVVVNDK